MFPSFPYTVEVVIYGMCMCAVILCNLSIIYTDRLCDEDCLLVVNKRYCYLQCSLIC